MKGKATCLTKVSFYGMTQNLLTAKDAVSINRIQISIVEGNNAH